MGHQLDTVRITVNDEPVQTNTLTTADHDVLIELRTEVKGIPADAIHMADMTISAGELGRWSCAHILRLVR